MIIGQVLLIAPCYVTYQRSIERTGDVGEIVSQNEFAKDTLDALNHIPSIVFFRPTQKRNINSGALRLV